MSIDKNGDGNLTFEELKTGLEQKQNAKELMEVMMAADTDNSGTINYTGKLFLFLVSNSAFYRIYCGHHGCKAVCKRRNDQDGFRDVRHR